MCRRRRSELRAPGQRLLQLQLCREPILALDCAAQCQRRARSLSTANRLWLQLPIVLGNCPGQRLVHRIAKDRYNRPWPHQDTDFSGQSVITLDQDCCGFECDAPAFLSKRGWFVWNRRLRACNGSDLRASPRDPMMFTTSRSPLTALVSSVDDDVSREQFRKSSSLAPASMATRNACFNKADTPFNGLL